MDMSRLKLRDPERIEPMLEKLKEAWEMFPDMRLGQLIMVCAGGSDVFSVEDDVMLEKIQGYIDGGKNSIN